jgi:hypothetical protein
MQKHKRYLLGLVSCVVAIGGVVGLGLADQTAPVTQSYGTDSVLQTGMIVRLKPGNSSLVEPLTDSDSSSVLGVVVSANDAALALTSNTSSRQVYVATYGKYGVLVSNQNGPVRSGDYVAISALDGVGMKANSDSKLVIGKALSNFDGNSNVQGTATLHDSKGRSLQVSIGTVNTQLNVEANPIRASSLPSGALGVLATIGYSVNDKAVSPFRLYLALFVLIIATLISGALLFGGVRSGIVSIGRNPLARKAIMLSLAQVVLTSFIIFILGVFAVYLLLKL